MEAMLLKGKVQAYCVHTVGDVVLGCIGGNGLLHNNSYTLN